MLTPPLKRFLEGAVTGAVLLAIAMFASGWAVKSSTAEQKAHFDSRDAVVERLAEICVAQFEQSEGKPVKLKAIRAIDSWRRGAYVAEQGWATMPGRDTADNLVADACAARLVKSES